MAPAPQPPLTPVPVITPPGVRVVYVRRSRRRRRVPVRIVAAETAIPVPTPAPVSGYAGYGWY
jgi:hypothetical protein